MSCCDHKFLITPWEIMSAGTKCLCASPGDCGAASSKKEESKLWDYAPSVLAAWCAPSISHSQLPQVRKQL